MVIGLYFTSLGSGGDAVVGVGTRMGPRIRCLVFRIGRCHGVRIFQPALWLGSSGVHSCMCIPVVICVFAIVWVMFRVKE